jgi:hypothetical protein
MPWNEAVIIVMTDTILLYRIMNCMVKLVLLISKNKYNSSHKLLLSFL